MSVGAISATWKLPAKFKRPSLHYNCLLAMADESDDDGFITCFNRSQNYIGFKIGCPDGNGARTVRRIISHYEQLGLIEVIESGIGKGASTYRLLYLQDVDSRSPGALFRAHRKELRESSPGEIQRGLPSPDVRAPQPSPEGSQALSPYSPFFPIRNPVDVRARSSSLKTWFEKVLWARYPRRQAKATAWREIHALNPGAPKRREIEAGLDRFVAQRASRAASTEDGFEEAAPLLVNWIKGRRWEDEA